GTAAPGAPAPAAPGWGAPGVAPPAAARPAPALPPAPLILPAPPSITVPGPFRDRRRSLADMANEQLRRGKPKDPLAEGMEGAGRDDCLHGSTGSGTPTVGGLLNAPSVIGRALTDKCAR
ncbi:hypothetical protein FN976_28120, partial [Caenimonas sedimenti]